MAVAVHFSIGKNDDVDIGPEDFEPVIGLDQVYMLRLVMGRYVPIPHLELSYSFPVKAVLLKEKIIGFGEHIRRL